MQEISSIYSILKWTGPVFLCNEQVITFNTLYISPAVSTTEDFFSFFVHSFLGHHSEIDHCKVVCLCFGFQTFNGSQNLSKNWVELPWLKKKKKAFLPTYSRGRCLVTHFHRLATERWRVFLKHVPAVRKMRKYLAHFRRRLPAAHLESTVGTVSL